MNTWSPKKLTESGRTGTEIQVCLTPKLQYFPSNHNTKITTEEFWGQRIKFLTLSEEVSEGFITEEAIA